MAYEILIIVILIVLNGLFSMAEISIVSSRKSRLEELLRKGKHGARDVMGLSANPNRFLSTVQIGITLIGVLTGVYGGDSIAKGLKIILAGWGLSAKYAGDVSLLIVVGIITYLTIVFGELLPKRIGLTNPESISLIVAKPMLIVSKIAAPFVWLLGITTDLFIRVFKIKKQEASQVTESEIKALVDEGAGYGAIEEIEQEIVTNAFFIGELRIDQIMTVRGDIVWLDRSGSWEENIARVLDNEHTIYPVCDGSIDNVVGVVSLKELFRIVAGKGTPGFSGCIKEPLFISYNQKAYQVLEKLKASGCYLAFVVNEYGEVEGIITINDILDELVDGATPDIKPAVVVRDDGSSLVDGRMPFFDFVRHFNIDDEEPIRNEFNTVAGLMIHLLEKIPAEADKVVWKKYIFEIVDMDGNRIDKILVRKISSKGKRGK